MTVRSALLLAFIATLRVVDWRSITSACPSIDTPQMSACVVVDSFFIDFVRDVELLAAGDDGGVDGGWLYWFSVAVMKRASVFGT